MADSFRYITKQTEKVTLQMPDFFSEFSKHQASGYMDLAQKLVWSKLFRYLGLKREGEHEFIDIVAGGKYWCTYFVSNVLAYFNMLPDACATVKSIETQLHTLWINRHEYSSGENVPRGAIIFRKVYDKEDSTISEDHVWFSLWDGEVISNSSYDKLIAIHSLTWSKDNMVPTHYYLF